MKSLVLMLLVTVACSVLSCGSKPKPRVPLPLQSNAPSQLVLLNARGVEEYHQRRFADAKAHFGQVVAGMPGSAEAHYNLGLTLFAMGESEQAREHFIEAANLAPGDKIIWDSPALRQYGSPESSSATKHQPDPAYSNTRPTLGGAPRR